MSSSSPHEPPPLIGQAPAFLELMERVSRAALLERPVLVIGERGSGKELIAARLHFFSARWDRALVKMNCAALAENLLETELFGHEAGAFTGAQKRRAGRFELADGGSLFLDEIAGASLAVQEKILRVVEYGEMERVGSSRTLEVDVRVIGAANVDLAAEAAAGRFRLDLLDRLAFEVLTVPPLRARPDDIPLLGEYFGRAMALELGRPTFTGFTPRVAEALAAYHWPGNVRELKNVVERAVFSWPDPETAVGEVVFDPFASPYRLGGGPPPPSPAEPHAPHAAHSQGGQNLKSILAGVEQGLLEDALAGRRFNQRAAAEDLGLTYHQMRGRLRKYGLLDP